MLVTSTIKIKTLPITTMESLCPFCCSSPPETQTDLLSLTVDDNWFFGVSDNRIIEYIHFCDRLLSLIRLFLTHLCVCGPSIIYFSLDNSLLYKYAMIYHPLFNICLASTLGMLFIKMLCRFTCKYLCGHIFAILLSKHQMVKLLSEMLSQITSACLIP